MPHGCSWPHSVTQTLLAPGTGASLRSSQERRTATDPQIHPDPALAQPAEPPLVVDGDELTADGAVRYVWRDDPACEIPTLGPLDGSVWRLADREAPWDVEAGEEITLYALGDFSGPELIASAPQMDWQFRRLPEGQTCPSLRARKLSGPATDSDEEDGG